MNAKAIALIAVVMVSGCNSFIMPSTIKDLGTPNINSDSFAEVVASTTDAVNAGVYSVPAGKVLVIRTVRIYPVTPGSGTLDVQLGQRIGGTNRAREQWLVPNSEPTQFDFSPGLVVASGSTLLVRNRPGSVGPIYVGISAHEADDR